MARFEVYAGPGPGYLLDCQADQLSRFKTRFVVPLLPAEGAVAHQRLHPVFQVRGRPYVMATHLASAVPVRELGLEVANFADQHVTIMNAIDMLLTGY